MDSWVDTCTYMYNIWILNVQLHRKQISDSQTYFCWGNAVAATVSEGSLALPTYLGSTARNGDQGAQLLTNLRKASCWPSGIGNK